MKHIFLSLFAICVSSLARCLFKSLVHFLIGLFVFLLLSFMSCLNILNNSPLSDMSSANIFSQPWAYLLILLRHRELKNFPGGSNMLPVLRTTGFDKLCNETCLHLNVLYLCKFTSSSLFPLGFTLCGITDI